MRYLAITLKTKYNYAYKSDQQKMVLLASES